MKWKPIETAPKDGGAVLLGGGDTPVTIGYWSDFFRSWQERGEGGGTCGPRYWMPLPPDPDENAESVDSGADKSLCERKHSGINKMDGTHGR